MQRRSTSHKEGRKDHDEADKGRPEREHIQDRKCHVGRANLDGQKVIPKSALWRGGQHKEHHDRAMHGEQAEVGFRLDLTHQWNRRVRPDHVNAHQQRQEHSYEHCRERQKKVLNANDFVVEAENVFPDEPLRSVRMNRSRGRHYCFSVSRAASHLSKSSWLTTCTMPCIL